MIKVDKGTAPADLVRLQSISVASGDTPKEAYKRLRSSLKTLVTNSLAREQGHLCAYCMCRISKDENTPEKEIATIEHFLPVAKTPTNEAWRALDYDNFYAVCPGNEKNNQYRGKSKLTCDKHRNDALFKKINPSDESSLSTIFYSMSGEISATDPDVKHDLTVILNLNTPKSPVLAERKATLDTLIVQLNNYRSSGGDIYKYCEKALKYYMGQKDPKTPYVGILIWYLKHFLGL